MSSSSRYGDIPANNLLMRECQKTSNNVAARLAVIPLVQVLSLIHIWLFFNREMIYCNYQQILDLLECFEAQFEALLN